jgi:hypothetical protein
MFNKTTRGFRDERNFSQIQQEPAVTVRGRQLLRRRSWRRHRPVSQAHRLPKATVPQGRATDDGAAVRQRRQMLHCQKIVKNRQAQRTFMQYIFFVKNGIPPILFFVNADFWTQALFFCLIIA